MNVDWLVFSLPGTRKTKMNNKGINLTHSSMTSATSLLNQIIICIYFLFFFIFSNIHAQGKQGLGKFQPWASICFLLVELCRQWVLLLVTMCDCIHGALTCKKQIQTLVSRALLEVIYTGMAEGPHGCPVSSLSRGQVETTWLKDPPVN